MTGLLSTLIVHETRLQYRYGIYAAYAFVIAFYFAALTWGGDVLPAGFVAFVIYSDPAVLGFFFLGALMMLEKSEGVRLALSVTPVSAWQYFLAKSVPLTLLGLLAVTVLSPFIHDVVVWPILLPAVLLTSLAYLGVGIPVALHFRTVTAYLMGSAGLMLPIILPAFLAFLDPMPVWAMAIPTAAQLRLIMAGIGAVDDGIALNVFMFLSATIGMVVAIRFGLARLEKEVGRK